jgi:hypothetical protein
MHRRRLTRPLKSMIAPRCERCSRVGVLLVAAGGPGPQPARDLPGRMVTTRTGVRVVTISAPRQAEVIEFRFGVGPPGLATTLALLRCSPIRPWYKKNYLKVGAGPGRRFAHLVVFTCSGSLCLALGACRPLDSRGFSGNHPGGGHRLGPQLDALAAPTLRSFFFRSSARRLI